MTNNEIRFDDGAAYERYMGKWSQQAGDAFLQWLAPPSGLRWLDVGCGNGAFTEMMMDRCAPASTDGIDPSDAQLAYANTRLAPRGAVFQKGNAMALPYADDAFEAAVMPLVLFFVPNPAVGVAEMARVVAAGGTVSAYAWDLTGGGFPYAAAMDELRRMGFTVPEPPSAEASRLENMQALWTGAGLDAVETCSLTMERTFSDFDDYWATLQLAPSANGTLASLSDAQRQHLQGYLRGQLPADAAGRITYSARAHAVKGRVPR